MSRSDEENWDDLSENEKFEFREEMKKNLSHKPKKENYIKKGKMFTDEIIISESVSIQEDLSSGDNLKDEKGYYPEKKEEKWFNIMLIGAVGTGKTTFMECFLRQYKHKNTKEPIKKHTENIYFENLSPNVTEPSLNMTILDTPGYDINSIAELAEIIKEEITVRMLKFREQSKEIMT